MATARPADYLPAARFDFLTPVFDVFVRGTTRERTFKRRLLAQARLEGGLDTLYHAFLSEAPGIEVALVQLIGEVLARGASAELSDFSSCSQRRGSRARRRRARLDPHGGGQARRPRPGGSSCGADARPGVARALRAAVDADKLFLVQMTQNQDVLSINVFHASAGNRRRFIKIDPLRQLAD